MKITRLKMARLRIKLNLIADLVGYLFLITLVFLILIAKWDIQWLMRFHFAFGFPTLLMLVIILICVCLDLFIDYRLEQMNKPQ